MISKIVFRGKLYSTGTSHSTNNSEIFEMVANGTQIFPGKFPENQRIVEFPQKKIVLIMWISVKYLISASHRSGNSS